jgi:hypothetical protein
MSAITPQTPQQKSTWLAPSSTRLDLALAKSSNIVVVANDVNSQLMPS